MTETHVFTFDVCDVKIRVDVVTDPIVERLHSEIQQLKDSHDFEMDQLMEERRYYEEVAPLVCCPRCKACFEGHLNTAEVVRPKNA